jgi:superfamily II DNA or RNA helicase
MFSEQKIEKKKNLGIPRVTFALDIKENFVHLVKDTKPLVAFYFKKSCTICNSLKVFLQDYLCEKHFLDLQDAKDFTPCSTDSLFYLLIESSNSTPQHHTILYRLPVSPSTKQYNEIVLLGGEESLKSDKSFIRKLKTALHLTPSHNKWKPQAHQEDCARWYHESGYKEKALLLHWGLGSGKSTGVLHMIESSRYRFPSHITKIYIVCPNTIIEYWHETVNTAACFISHNEIQKPLQYIIVGYTQFEKLCKNEMFETRKYIYNMKKNKSLNKVFLNDSIVIVDECQHYRNVSNAMIHVLYALQFSYQTIGLTGTLFINDVEDVLGGIALMKGPITNDNKQEIIWKTVEDLQYDLGIWKKSLEEKDTTLIEKTFKNRAYFFDPQLHDTTNLERAYPYLQKYTHFVNMSLVQMYEYLRNQKKSIDIGPVTITSSVRNAYNTLLKSLSNTCEADGIYAPKFQALKKKIHEIGKFPQVIFSRFLEKGVKSLYNHLGESFPGKKIALVTGETPTSQRNKIVIEYNSGKIDILLLSNVGGVGLDLHNTVAMHLLESFENLQSELQASHRVARYNSHIRALIESKTRPIVEIHKYISVFPNLKGIFSKDEISKVEKTFNQHYGDLVTLQKNTSSKLQFYQSTTEKDDNETWSIGDILQQLKEQLTHPITIEENMTYHNLQKQKEIEPFFKTFTMYAAQPSINSKEITMNVE